MTGTPRRDRRRAVGVAAPPEGGVPDGCALLPNVMARGIGASSRSGSRYDNPLDHRSRGPEQTDEQVNL